MIRSFLIVMCIYCSIPAYSQLRSIVVIGSSTVAGTGATLGHAWVPLTSKYLKAKGLIDTIYNLGLSGQTTWDGLPTGSPHPTGSDSANPARNVTKALSFHPKLVIVSFPSNDIHNGWTVTQYLANLRLIYQTVVASGTACIITTTQPRDGMNPGLRKANLDATDSIMQEYALRYLDFYDTLVDRHSKPDSLNIKAQYEYGDGIHVNDSGHMALFNITSSSQALITSLAQAPLAIGITSFEARLADRLGVLLTWSAVTSERRGIFTIQRSADGVSFIDAGMVAALSGTTEAYSWRDEHPAEGDNYYRLHVTGDGGDRYSSVVACRFTAARPEGLAIQAVYASGEARVVQVSIGSDRDVIAAMTIFDLSGTPILRRRLPLTAPTTRTSFSFPGLAGGVYIVRVRDGVGRVSVYRFLCL